MRELRSLLLLIAAVFLPLTQTQTSECIDFTPSMDDRGEPSSDLTATTMKSLALVLTNYTFSCNGFLDQWNIYWELENVERCEIVMDFHILRPTKTADFCGLVSVASTQVVLTPPDHPGRQTVISSFSVSDSVRVETGDLVGLVVMFSDSERCPPAARVSVLETSNPSDPDLVYLAIQASQEDDLELGSIAGFGCDDSSSDASDKTRSSTTTRGRDDTQTSSARHTPRTGTSRPVTPRPDTPRPVTPRLTPIPVTPRPDTPRPVNPDTSSRSTPERDSSPERSDEEDSSDDDKRKKSRERSKRTHGHNHFKVYHGAPLINAVVEPEMLATATVPNGEPFATATVPTGEPSATVPTGEPRDQEAMGSGELEEEEEGAGLRDMMIPAGVVVGVLAVGGVGAVVVALACCLCYRAKQRHSQEGDFNISDNKAYSSTSATSPLGHSKEEKAAGRKPPVKPRPRYSMSDNTAYSTHPETWGVPQHHPTPHYITPKKYLTPKTGDSRDTCNDHLYVVDGKIYEMPSQM